MKRVRDVTFLAARVRFDDSPHSTPFDIFGWLLLYGRALALYL
jgi:hypothetical protein